MRPRERLDLAQPEHGPCATCGRRHERPAYEREVQATYNRPEQVAARLAGLPRAATDARAEWQPVVYGKHACQHTVWSPGAGWFVDCDESASFIRSTKYGGHQYSCPAHVSSSWDDEGDDE